MTLIVKQLIASEELQRPCSGAQIIQQPLKYVKETSLCLEVPGSLTGGECSVGKSLIVGGKTVITSKQVRDLFISRKFL